MTITQTRDEGHGRCPLLPLGLLLALPLLVACGSTPKQTLVVDEALVDPHAGRRTRAVAEVARTHDESQVPELIEMLDDPDPGVRMAAGATLRELTGHDTGYEPWMPPERRREQVKVWRAWWEAQGRTRPHRAPTPQPGGPPRGVAGRGVGGRGP